MLPGIEMSSIRSWVQLLRFSIQVKYRFNFKNLIIFS